VFARLVFNDDPKPPETVAKREAKWDQTFSFKVVDLDTDLLSVHVYQFRMTNKAAPPLIGVCQLKPKTFIVTSQQSYCKKWYVLQDPYRTADSDERYAMCLLVGVCVCVCVCVTVSMHSLAFDVVELHIHSRSGCIYISLLSMSLSVDLFLLTSFC
jgi:C2 domain